MKKHPKNHPRNKLSSHRNRHLGLTSLLIAAHAGFASASSPQALNIDPISLPKVGMIDDNFQSYNVEMVEVTGGRFWKPYASVGKNKTDNDVNSGNAPTGTDPDLYEYRPPMDLSNTRLRKLASALSPAYMRVSGTWANFTYFPGPDENLDEPPEGFKSVLTRDQWKGVTEFSQSVGAPIVTSFAISQGTRDDNGGWTPTTAKRLIEYTESLGSHIAAAEFMNEPTVAKMGGAPEGYTVEDYGRDFDRFYDFARENAPYMRIVGPGGVGESTQDSLLSYGTQFFATEDLLKNSSEPVDAFSFHHYGAVSKRCAEMDVPKTSKEKALSEEWLAKTDHTADFYRELRDEYTPGAPLWNTETAEAACGGNPWAKTYLDSFRYLDQMGRLAKSGVEVVMHNTLAASDYALLDEETYEPHPNYWAALLWKRLMGNTVLDSGIPVARGQHVYAHCQANQPGSVSMLVINNDTENSLHLNIPQDGERYTLSADSLTSMTVRLNGEELKLGQDDELPSLLPAKHEAGKTAFEPATITFVTLPDAANTACKL